MEAAQREGPVGPDAGRVVAGVGERSLSPLGKLCYGLGDLTLSSSLTALSMIYASFYLTQVAGLRPALAGAVPLVGRLLDAVTDPLMGRLSDHTRWRAGRRRPWLLIGAVPFGASFALLWTPAPIPGQAGLFAYYAAIYCLFSLAVTVLYVPYLALLPEMAVGYDERTSLNTYRSVVSALGIFLAIGVRPLAEALGGGSAGFAGAGALFGGVLVLPWLLVHRVTFERPAFARETPTTSFGQAFRQVLRHGTFVRLCVFYLSGRLAMDLASTLLILYATFYLGRGEGFELVMLAFITALVCAFPLALRISRDREKSSIYVYGAVWWTGVSVLQFVFQPEWPFWIFLCLVPLIAPGFAIVDLMPWSMLGEVIDEDELESGERREGLYNGVFSFLRKLGGALGVAVALWILDFAGFRESRGGELVAQPESARQAIRVLSAFGPAVCLLFGAWLASAYPLTRGRHDEIRARLEARRGAAEGQSEGEAAAGG